MEITWLGHRTAIRCLRPLLLPAVVLLLPFQLARTVSLVAAIGEGGVIANGQLEAAGATSVFWVGWRLALALLGAVASLAVAAVGVVVAAGTVLGVPVTPRAAADMVRRRLGLLVALTVAAFIVVAAILAAWIGLVWIGAPAWLGLGVIVMGSLLVLPYLLVFPAAILERRSLRAAVGRVHRILAFRRTRFATGLVLTIVVPAVTAALVPGLFAWPLDGLWRTC